MCFSDSMTVTFYLSPICHHPQLCSHTSYSINWKTESCHHFYHWETNSLFQWCITFSPKLSRLSFNMSEAEGYPQGNWETASTVLHDYYNHSTFKQHLPSPCASHLFAVQKEWVMHRAYTTHTKSHIHGNTHAERQHHMFSWINARPL